MPADLPLRAADLRERAFGTRPGAPSPLRRPGAEVELIPVGEYLAFALRAAALGTEFLSGADLDVARGFCERYTRRGRSPADELPLPARSQPEPAVPA